MFGTWSDPPGPTLEDRSECGSLFLPFMDHTALRKVLVPHENWDDVQRVHGLASTR
jgi:hypothetical protein